MSKNQKKEHKDTRVSLHPLSFEEAIEKLATPTKRKKSKAERTKKDALQPGTSDSQTSRHQ